MIIYRMYIVPFTLYILIWLERYAHGIFAAGWAIVPTQEKKMAKNLESNDIRKGKGSLKLGLRHRLVSGLPSKY